MSFHKILCPVDFSAGSTNALRAAARLAVRDHAELVVVHVAVTPALIYASETPLPAELLTEQLDAGDAKLAEAVTEARALGVANVSALLERGTAWDQIVATLADPTFDLCVIGTHGRTGIARVALGSVAEQVVRHAPCSVLTVRSELAPVRHVLCPVDFSPSAARASELAVHLVEPHGTLTLLHVLDLPVAASGEVHDPGLAAALGPDSSRELAEWRDRLAARTDVTIELRTRLGYPGAQILHELEHDATIDLVALGSHGRTGLGRVLLGSVAEKITRHAHCAVLVAHLRG
jgi:nucleotide-binding universal stress UspA family protein